LAVTEDGELLIADSGNHRIRIVSKNRVVSTLAGSGEVGFKNGPFSVSQFSSPSGICISSSGNIFVSDRGNHVIRHINRSDQEVTLHCGYPGWAGNSSGFHTNATLYHPGSLRIGYGGEILVVPELYLREKPFHVYAIHREGYCRKRYKIPNVSGIQDIFPGPNGVYFTRKVSGSLLIQDLEGDHRVLIGEGGKVKLSYLGYYFDRILPALLPERHTDYCRLIMEGVNCYKPKLEKIVHLTPDKTAASLIQDLVAQGITSSKAVLISSSGYKSIAPDTLLAPLLASERQNYRLYSARAHLLRSMPTFIITTNEPQYCYVNMYESRKTRRFVIKHGFTINKLKEAIAKRYPDFPEDEQWLTNYEGIKIPSDDPNENKEDEVTVVHPSSFSPPDSGSSEEDDDEDDDEEDDEDDKDDKDDGGDGAKHNAAAPVVVGDDEEDEESQGDEIGKRSKNSKKSKKVETRERRKKKEKDEKDEDDDDADDENRIYKNLHYFRPTQGTSVFKHPQWKGECRGWQLFRTTPFNIPWKPGNEKPRQLSIAAYQTFSAITKRILEYQKATGGETNFLDPYNYRIEYSERPQFRKAWIGSCPALTSELKRNILGNIRWKRRSTISFTVQPISGKAVKIKGFDPDDYLYDFRREIERKMGVPLDQQRIILPEGRLLYGDGRQLWEFNLEHSGTVRLIRKETRPVYIRMFGCPRRVRLDLLNYGPYGKN
jgi:hypothetical protein